MPQTLRPFHAVLLVAVVAMLPACAGTQQRSLAKAGAEDEVVTVRSDDPYAYRFDMTQKGKRMSADDFDAWMKAKGLRIAKGGPASEGDKAKVAAAKRKRD